MKIVFSKHKVTKPLFEKNVSDAQNGVNGTICDPKSTFVNFSVNHLVIFVAFYLMKNITKWFKDSQNDFLVR